MVGDLNGRRPAPPTLGGAVALLTSGTTATSGSRLHKRNNKLSGGIQTMMEYDEFDEATVAYILCFFHCLFHYYLLCRLLSLPGEIPGRNSLAYAGRKLPVI